MKSKQQIIPRPRTTDDEPASHTLVYVQYTGSELKWGKSTSSMVSLSQAIVTRSSTAITYEFVSTGSAAIWYKLPPDAPNGTQLPSSDGPTAVVRSGSRTSVAFAPSSGGPYSTGWVKVSDDDIDP